MGKNEMLIIVISGSQISCPYHCAIFVVLQTSLIFGHLFN